MATHSSILAWEIPSTEEPGGLEPMEFTKESDRTRQLNNNNISYWLTKSIQRNSMIAGVEGLDTSLRISVETG